MQEVENEGFTLIVHHENIYLPFLYFVHSSERQLISYISQRIWPIWTPGDRVPVCPRSGR